MRQLDKILIIDLEATCWETDAQRPEHESSEIIEIGAVLVDIKTIKFEKKSSILVKPVRSRISKFCNELTTLTQEQVDTGVSLREACNRLKKEFLSNERTWASWGDYDRNMMRQSCEHEGVAYPFGPRHINLKNMFAVLNGLPRELGMPAALQKANLPLVGTHHRGDDDATNIANLFIKMVGQFRGT